MPHMLHNLKETVCFHCSANANNFKINDYLYSFVHCTPCNSIVTGCFSLSVYGHHMLAKNLYVHMNVQISMNFENDSSKSKA